MSTQIYRRSTDLQLHINTDMYEYDCIEDLGGGGGQQKNIIQTENCEFENTGILLCSVTMGLGTCTSSNIYFALSPKMLKEVQN